MARVHPRPDRASDEIRALIFELRSRFAALAARGGEPREWFHLRFEAIQALADAQGKIVRVHAAILSTLHADREVYRELKIESGAMSLEVDRLCDLIREIEAEMRRHESTN